MLVLRIEHTDPVEGLLHVGVVHTRVLKESLAQKYIYYDILDLTKHVVKDYEGIENLMEEGNTNR